MMMLRAAEVAMFEMRHMTEPEHKVAIAELQHQPRVPEVPEVPRLEVRCVSKPECEASVAEGPEVPRLGRPRLSNYATVMELEARLMQVQLWHGVPRELPKPKPRSRASVGCGAIANAATTVASTIILRIAAAP